MDDHLKRLKDADAAAERAARERQLIGEQRGAAEREYEGAWQAVSKCCLAGDRDDSKVPDLSPFIALIAVLEKRGWLRWLPEMATNISQDLDSHFFSRRDELFIVTLLMEASKKGANQSKLAKVYSSRTKGQSYPTWRTSAASDIREFFSIREQQAIKDAERADEEAKRLQAKQAAQAKLAQVEIVRAAGSRGEVCRNLQFLARHIELKGSDTTARINVKIRDWWDQQHPDRPCNSRKDRRKGAEVVRAGIRAAKAFVEKMRSQGVTLSIEEMVEATSQDR